jgi:ABC-type phosphate transport system substrate-binding protein
VALTLLGTLILCALPALASVEGGSESPSGAAAPSSAPGLHVSLSLSKQLVDGQFVVVSWKGFPADGLVYVRQCAASPRAVGDCTKTLVNGTSDGTGAGDVLYQVHTGDLGTFTCDYRHACTIAAFANSNSLSRAGVVAISFAFPPDACPTPSGETVAGSGATSLPAVMLRWEATLCRAPLSTSVRFTVKNSVDGLGDFARGAVDFAGSSMPLPASDRAQLAADGTKYVYAPLALSGLVFAFNLHDRNTGQRITSLNLTPELLAQIFTGQILNWQDPRIEALNPGVAFPPVLRAIGRADNSASTLEVTSYFDATARAAYEAGGPAFQGGPTDTYPVISSVNLLTGAAAVATEIASPAQDNDPRTFGQIGWVDSSTAALYGLPTVAVENAAGTFTQATTASLDAALQDAFPNPDGVTVRPDFTTDDPRAYPLPTVSYAVLSTNHADAGVIGPLDALLNYAVGPGQANLPPGYSALTPDMAAATSIAIAELHAQGPSSTPSPTPTTPLPTGPTPTATFPSVSPPPLPNVPIPSLSLSVSPAATPTASVAPTGVGAPSPSASPSLVAVAIDPAPPGTGGSVFGFYLVLGLLCLLLGPAILMWGRRPQATAAPGAAATGATAPDASEGQPGRNRRSARWNPFRGKGSR